MATELPYFRFTVSAWQNGKIGIESYELKGLFIDVCGYYWISDCNATLTMLKKRFSNATGLLELIELGIIKHENRHDKVEIEFLNIQYDLLSEKRKLRQSAGSKGGNAKAKLKQKGSYKDKDKDKDKDKVIYKYNFYQSLIDYGFKENLIKEWMQVRKTKKATNTETAFNSFIKQVEICKTDKNLVLEKCIEKSWSGFKAEWILTETSFNKPKQNHNLQGTL